MLHHPIARCARRQQSLIGALAVSLALGTACTTTESKRPVAPKTAVIHRAEPARSWDVLAAGEVAGRVVYFAAEDAPDRSLYMVRNLYQQDLGWIDSLGRAYRLLPHHRDPAWVGTGTVAQGVERILRIDGACSLVETPLAGAPQEAPEALPGR